MPPAVDPGAFAGLDRNAEVVRLAGATMGTGWTVTCVAGAAAPDAIRAAVVARLAELVVALSHWEAGSAVSAFARAPAGAWVALPRDLAAVIETALAVATASDGAFDPAIGRIVDLWGFGPPGAIPPPTDSAIALALAAGGWRRLALDRDAMRLRQPGGVALDLSGIAKGYAVDAVAAAVRGLGVRHALVEIGGELVGWGVRPDGEPWWVDLEAPPGFALAPLRVALHGLAVATSGSYVRGEHTLDPRTGRPITNGVVATSVIADSAMLADALATALTVAWPDVEALLARWPVAARIVTADGGEHLTPALATMLAE